MNLWQFGKKGDNGPGAAQQPQATTAAKAAIPNIQGLFNKGNALIQGAMQSGGGKGNGSLPANAYKVYEQPTETRTEEGAEENYSPKAYRVQPTNGQQDYDPAHMAENAIPHVPQPKPKARPEEAVPDNVTSLFPEKVEVDPNEPLGNAAALDNLIRSVDELLYADGNGKPAPAPQSLDTVFETPAPEEAYAPVPEAYNPPPAEETYAPEPEAYNPPAEEAYVPPAETPVPDLNEFMAANSLEFVSTAKPPAEESYAPPAEEAYAPPADANAYAEFEVPVTADYGDFVPPADVAPEVAQSYEAPAPEAYAPPAEEAKMENPEEGFGEFDEASLLAELKASVPNVEPAPEPVAAKPKYSDEDLSPPVVGTPVPLEEYAPVAFDPSFEPDPAVAAVPAEEAYDPPQAAYEEPQVAYEPAPYEEPAAVYPQPEEAYAPPAEMVYNEQPAYEAEPLPLTSYTAEGYDAASPAPYPEVVSETAYAPEYPSPEVQPEYGVSTEYEPAPEYETEMPAYVGDPGDENDYSDDDYSDYEDAEDEAAYEETEASYDDEVYEEEAAADEYYAEPYDNPYSDYNVIDGQPKFDLDAPAAPVAAAPVCKQLPKTVQDFEARTILEESRFVKNSIDQLVSRYFGEYSPDAQRQQQ